MMTITAAIDKFNPDMAVISRAAEVIKSGGLVAFPTETVYGLGADALNPEAVKKIFTAKGRPSDNPLILHVSSISEASRIVEMNDKALNLAAAFWPAPLTIVLPAKNEIPLITRGGLSTAAVRMPDNPVALSLIKAAGTPIAAPSANISGHPSPTDFESVYHDMNGKIDFILDGGSVKVGIESTVIDMTNPERALMLRPGGMPRELIEDVLKMRLEVPDSDSSKRSPGTRYKHYSPDIPVIIWHRGNKLPDNINPETSAYMGLDDPENFKTAGKILFSSVSDYARGLFSWFRKFEKGNFQCVIVQWPEDNSGLSEGLKDRISRAAGK